MCRLADKFHVRWRGCYPVPNREYMQDQLRYTYVTEKPKVWQYKVHNSHECTTTTLQGGTQITYVVPYGVRGTTLILGTPEVLMEKPEEPPVGYFVPSELLVEEEEEKGGEVVHVVEKTSRPSEGDYWVKVVAPDGQFVDHRWQLVWTRPRDYRPEAVMLVDDQGEGHWYIVRNGFQYAIEVDAGFEPLFVGNPGNFGHVDQKITRMTLTQLSNESNGTDIRSGTPVAYLVDLPPASGGRKKRSKRKRKRHRWAGRTRRAKLPRRARGGRAGCRGSRRAAF